jgi:recombination protein RecT
MSAAKSSASKALEKVDAAAQGKGTLTLLEMIDRQATQIEKALPAHVDRDRFVRIAITAINKPNSKLHQCEPLSVIAGMMDAAQLGLEISDVTGQAYLIPRKVGGRMVATFQVGYQGLIDMAARYGITVAADSVRIGDQISYQKGTHAELVHVPNIDVDDEDDPDKIRAFYAIAYFEDGRRPMFDIKSKGWMERHRAKFAARKADDAVWWVHFEAMGIKTMIRRLLKQLPTSAELRTAIEKDTVAFVQSPQAPESKATAPATDVLADIDHDDEDENVVDAELEEEEAATGEALHDAGCVCAQCELDRAALDQGPPDEQ